MKLFSFEKNSCIYAGKFNVILQNLQQLVQIHLLADAV